MLGPQTTKVHLMKSLWFSVMFRYWELEHFSNEMQSVLNQDEHSLLFTWGMNHLALTWAISILALLCLFATPWTVALQAPLFMEFSRQEYWSGLPFPPPGELLSPETEPGSPALQADSLPSEPPGKPNIYMFLSTL
ncbi:unnamed protein product [Rangifer tarandus platyrhynchus]|uniref:Uncharacterized protein n=1 Tax=Rangifer tarandus platyrhynchus TaxID=3082113 RepID=A0ABN9A767_RANTA|nr:unnamed protein product [Rangifer tarandus platyrhynchus]